MLCAVCGLSPGPVDSRILYAAAQGALQPGGKGGTPEMRPAIWMPKKMMAEVPNMLSNTETKTRMNDKDKN